MEFLQEMLSVTVLFALVIGLGQAKLWLKAYARR